MKCNKQYTIKVVRDNSFALVLPLKRRTFVSNKPIDTDIDCAELRDVVLKIGGVEYTAQCGLDGVRVVLQDGLPVGTYDIDLTATYRGSQIRAAYYQALQSVDWNMNSDAEQYLPGSPIVAEAAYIIGGVLDDAELAELKEQYRQAIIAEQEAEAAAEAKEQEYAERIEHLDDIATDTDVTTAKQAILDAMSTDTGLIRGDVSDAKEAIRGDLSSDTTAIRGDIAAVANAIAHIDFSALATKQGQQEAAAVLATILQRIGAPDDPATANTLFGAILNIASQIDFTTVIQKLDAMWGTNAQATLTAILAAVNAIDTSDPNSKALAEFFGVTLPSGYEFMQDTEVTDELEDIMQTLDPELTAEQAASITAEAMNIINPSQS